MSIISKSETMHFLGSKGNPEGKDAVYRKLLHSKNEQIKHLCNKLRKAKRVCKQLVKEHKDHLLSQWGKNELLKCECNFCEEAHIVFETRYKKEKQQNDIQ